MNEDFTLSRFFFFFRDTSLDYQYEIRFTHLSAAVLSEYMWFFPEAATGSVL